MTDLEQHLNSIANKPYDRRDMSPQVVDLYVRRGRQLRAQALRRGASALWSALAGALRLRRRRRMGRLSARAAH